VTEDSDLVVLLEEEVEEAAVDITEEVVVDLMVEQVDPAGPLERN